MSVVPYGDCGKCRAQGPSWWICYVKPQNMMYSHASCEGKRGAKLGARLKVRSEGSLRCCLRVLPPAVDLSLNQLRWKRPCLKAVSVCGEGRGPSFDVCAVSSSATGRRPSLRTSVLLASAGSLLYEFCSLRDQNPWNIDKWRFLKGDRCATFKVDLWFFTFFPPVYIYFWALFETVNWFCSPNFTEAWRFFILFNNFWRNWRSSCWYHAETPSPHSP